MNFLDFLLDKNNQLLALLGPEGSIPSRLGSFTEWFIFSLVLFALLAKAFPSVKQPTYPGNMKTDLIYWFGGPVVYPFIFVLFMTLYSKLGFVQDLNTNVSYWMHMHLHVEKVENGKMHFTDMLQWNVAIQALLILLVSDFFQYWLHRFFHRDPLWDYHSIHHSPTHIDWLTSVRFHPVNIILYSTSVNAFVAIMGFDFEAFLLLQPFNMIYSPLVHANLKWSYGPFKYIVAGPVFHRWHHTKVDEGGQKNFAPTFSFLDVIFGTFYMPKGKQPENFGIEGNPVPEDFLGQMAHPFKAKKKP